MEEPMGAQFAIHIAVHTLKDRCRSLQQRVTYLEEENLRLRLQTADNPDQIPEHDQLKQQLVELTEQNVQLQNKVKMVTGENQELWNKLSRLSKVNKNLGTELSKINDSLVQHTSKGKEVHSPLIRSRTFTQEEPHIKILQRNLEENNKISSELQEISLKIINSFAQGKNELETLCMEIADFNVGTSENIITDSFGFYYDDNVIEQLSLEVAESRALKELAMRQQDMLQAALNELTKLRDKSNCDKKNVKEMVDKSTATVQPQSPSKEATPPPKVPTSPPVIVAAVDMICPLCSKNYLDIRDLEQHVERHFIDESFDIIS